MRLKPVTVKADDFMCRCGKRGEERCDRVLAHARKLSDSERMPTGDNDVLFIDRLLYGLSLDGELSIAADQWAGVSWKRWEDGPSCFIQCDSIVDGLAAAYVFAEQTAAPA